MYLYYIVQAALFWRFSCTRRYPSPYSYQWSVTSLLWSISTLVLSTSVWPWPRRETPRTWPCITTGAGSPRRTSKEWPLSWPGTWFIESCLRFLIEGVSKMCNSNHVPLSYRMESYNCITDTLAYLLSASVSHPHAPSVPKSPGPPPQPDPNRMTTYDAEKHVRFV